MIEHLYEDLSVHLYEGEPITKKAPTPPPITYLTQWKMMGNSEVHTDEYLTQWKVLGNSVVDNPSANLPQGYKKCKYLESHETEYIELPFGFDNTDEVYAKAAFIDLTRLSDMFFVAPKTWNDDGNRYGLGYHYNFGAAYGSKSTGQTTFIPLKEADIDIHTYSYANELFTFDDGISSRDVSDIEFGSTTDNLRLFHTYDKDIKCRIYAYHHVKANNVEVNLIPCLDDNDVPCLYDTVSNTTFYNDGTGTFGYELEQPAILSCGDLGQDGKYHVKISNGVTIYDIPLTEPLRKVNDVADTIEFANGVGTVTRKIASVDMSRVNYTYRDDLANPVFQVQINGRAVGRTNVLSSLYSVSRANAPANLSNMETMGHWSVPIVYFRNDAYTNATEFKNAMSGVELIYELATPTTETIQVSPFPVSPTDTYTSANETAYSAFEYKKNVEIWSCGEYNATDGKYHILVQPLGGSIADIALDEPLRKVNDVADSIEFPTEQDGKALVTRNIKEINMGEQNLIRMISSVSDTYRFYFERADAYEYDANNQYFDSINSAGYINVRGNDTYNHSKEIRMIGMYPASVFNTPVFMLYDPNYNQSDSLSGLLEYLSDKYMIYRLATPTTEVIQVPQIQEAESYSCVISQGGKAVEWSSFETDND